MRQYFTMALLLTGCAFIVSLVYKPLFIPTIGNMAPSPAANLISEVSTTTTAVPHTIDLNEFAIRVSIADTRAGREQGLSGREGLASDEGMLFVFPEDGLYPFWMKDMRFSIDIIWISHDGFITNIAENVSPTTYPESFTPDTPARYVLELPAGWVSSHGVRLGSLVKL